MEGDFTLFELKDPGYSDYELECLDDMARKLRTIEREFYFAFMESDDAETFNKKFYHEDVDDLEFLRDYVKFYLKDGTEYVINWTEPKFWRLSLLHSFCKDDTARGFFLENAFVHLGK